MASASSTRSWRPRRITSLTPCHNCHTQIEDIGEHYGGAYHVTHLWTLICLSLGILGPDERKYLGRISST